MSVLIVGGGPVGFMLAGDLRLHGVPVVVLEALPAVPVDSRGASLTRRTVELLQQRGIAPQLGDSQRAEAHFGGVPMDVKRFREDHSAIRGVPQIRTHQALEAWATQLGVQVFRRHTVTGVEQHDDHVRVEFAGAQGRNETTATYVVGCDGVRSVVRQAIGATFEGSRPRRGFVTADLRGVDIRRRRNGEDLPGGNMVMAMDLPGGVTRVVLYEQGTPPSRGIAPRFEDVVDAWRRLTGESIREAECLAIDSFSDATRVADTYRKGRVFLVGDAAHVQPPAMAQGLSVGIQDAANLGWKLAATIHGWAPPDLLDTYHAERHPLGQQLIRNAQAAVELRLSGDQMDPLREIVSELLTHHDAAEHLAGMLSGIGIRYDLAVGNHPLLGRRIPPDLPFSHNDETTTVQDLLTHCRGLLITPPGSPHAQQAKPWSDRIDIIEAHPNPAPHHHDIPSTSLIRPDGYIAWTDPDTTTSLTTALNRWFGKPQARPHK